MLARNEAIALINQLGATHQAFSFYCDFLGKKWCVETSPRSFNLVLGKKKIAAQASKVDLKKTPVSFEDYQTAFDKVVQHINVGNSFLTNLTFQTAVETSLTLDQIFQQSTAKYKLLVPNQFVVFSPETFVQIKGNQIFSYPMKGTIDASLTDAKQRLLNDEKEIAEHVTIVDLLRNDLSQVANDVHVPRFRYIDEIATNEKRLLQVSSEVKGTLPDNWPGNLGYILSSLLPAGSISGAPKPKTIDIIQQVENYDRDFFTGICGHFDGESLDSGVMIRFIKQVDNQLIYCSGGGITSFSQAEKEYQEMVDKVYLPI